MQSPSVIADGKVHWVVRCYHVWPPSALYSYIITGPYWSEHVGVIFLP